MNQVGSLVFANRLTGISACVLLNLITSNVGLQIGKAVETGNTVLWTISATQKANVTIPYERCLDVRALKVYALAKSTDSNSTVKFDMIPFKYNLLSFEADLIRKDNNSGWDYMSLSIQWQAYYPAELTNIMPGDFNMTYTYLNQSITWTMTKNYCNQKGMVLCSSKQLCINQTMLLTGEVMGVRWTPASDEENHWVKLGGGIHLCAYFNYDYEHVELEWGTKSTPCPPWNYTRNPCPLKGHVFCCS